MTGIFIKAGAVLTALLHDEKSARRRFVVGMNGLLEIEESVTHGCPGLWIGKSYECVPRG